MKCIRDREQKVDIWIGVTQVNSIRYHEILSKSYGRCEKGTADRIAMRKEAFNEKARTFLKSRTMPRKLRKQFITTFVRGVGMYGSKCVDSQNG